MKRVILIKIFLFNCLATFFTTERLTHYPLIVSFDISASGDNSLIASAKKCSSAASSMSEPKISKSSIRILVTQKG